MKDEIILRPIGKICTPYKAARGVPIQGSFNNDIEGRAEVCPEYTEGLKDLERFSHIILIYYFDRITEEKIVTKPFLEDEPHGIFAIRSPMRPNHIGLSVVKLKNIHENIIIFSEVDMLDNTPLLDIKPYVSYFDSREDVRNGWIDKHFINGEKPGAERLKVDLEL